MDRKLEYFIECLYLPLFSDIANYKKDIRIVKYNRRGDVVMHCLSPPSYSYHYFMTSLIIRKRYVLPNTACEVMYVAMYCLRHGALEGGMRIVSF